MSFDNVTIRVDVDTTDADAKIDNLTAKSDAATEKARLQRLEIIQGVRESLTLISTAYSTFTQFMRVIGAQIDPFFSALIGMTLSTVSMMLSMSAALAATGVGITAAIVLGGIAITLNAMLITKLLVDKAKALELFNVEKWSDAASQLGTGLGGF